MLVCEENEMFCSGWTPFFHSIWTPFFFFFKLAVPAFFCAPLCCASISPEPLTERTLWCVPTVPPPPCAMIGGWKAGLAGRCGSGWGMKASGAARGHLHTEPCLCVCFIFNCFPWPQAELPCQRPSHGRRDLPLPLSLSLSPSLNLFPFSPSISSSFLPLSFVRLSINVLRESSRRQVNVSVCEALSRTWFTSSFIHTYLLFENHKV